MFTTAEQRALDQLSTDGGRLAVARGRSAHQAAWPRAESAGAARRPRTRCARSSSTSSRRWRRSAPALLLDPEIALPHVIDAGALPARTGLLVSLERSGAAAPPAGCAARAACPAWRGGCAPAGRHRRQAARAPAAPTVRTPTARTGASIRAAVADCAAHDLLLVVEVLVLPAGRRERERVPRPPRRADPRGGAAGESCGARYLKLEYPGQEAACAGRRRRRWRALGAALGRRRPRDVRRPAARSRWPAARPGSSPAARSGRRRSPWTREARRAFLAGEARRRLAELLAIAS